MYWDSTNIGVAEPADVPWFGYGTFKINVDFGETIKKKNGTKIIHNLPKKLIMRSIN